MTIPNSWLVSVNVSINTNVTALPAFNKCSFIGVMPVPSAWMGAGYGSYSSLSAFLVDFTTLLAVAVTDLDVLQANRYTWLIEDVTAFFAQSPTPAQIYIFALAPQTPSTSYTTAFNAYTASQNNWYGFSIADLIFANSSSIAIVQISVATMTSAVLTAGTTATTLAAVTSPYTLLQDVTLANTTGSTIIYNVPFYSTDITTVVPASPGANAFTAISPSPAAVILVANALPAGPATTVPGYLTAASGVNVGLVALRSAGNQKKLFADFLDNTQAGLIQTAGGNEDLTCFFHSLNFESYTTTSNLANLAAAVMGKYFVNLFVGNNGLTIISSLQLAGEPVDPSITPSNIGNPGEAGGPNSLINWNNNVYAAFGSNSVGLVQYGYQSNSTSSAPIYLDQVVGADYVQFVVQANLITYILDSLPSGIPYSDLGIQGIVGNFKASLNQSVAQNVIQPFNNNQISYFTYAQVQASEPGNIAARLYNNLSFSGKFLSRIQQIKVNITLSL